ncbi:MAG: FixH family protein [Burkholderiales bacterium]|nr:FixH family protein [Burkholderiales bacterium]
MQTIPQLKPAAVPWYREPWPWLLMSGPAAVIVAGVYTTMLAFQSSDGLVADDYYKQGLAINRTLGREERARALGLGAVARLDADGRIELDLQGAQHPPQLMLRLTHPTRAGMDQRVGLAHQGAGRYSGRLDARALEGRWNVFLETVEWRLAGSWQDPARGPLTLAAVR